MGCPLSVCERGGVLSVGFSVGGPLGGGGAVCGGGLWKCFRQEGLVMLSDWVLAELLRVDVVWICQGS